MGHFTNIWKKDMTIDMVLRKLQVDAIAMQGKKDALASRQQERRKARMMLQEVVEKHYKKGV